MDGDPVVIVPNTDHQRYLQYPGRIYGLKEDPFAGTCVADRSPGYFIAMVREFSTGETFNVSIYFGCLGQAQQSGHLSRRTGDIRTTVFLSGKVFPTPILV